MPIDMILALRGACPVHLQLEVDEVQPPGAWPGEARVVGRAVRVFRGPVTAGTVLTLRFGVTRPGARHPLGGTSYLWDHLRSFRFLEVFLDERDGSLRLPYTELSEVIDGPSETPRMEWSTPRADWITRLRRWLTRR